MGKLLTSFKYFLGLIFSIFFFLFYLSTPVSAAEIQIYTGGGDGSRNTTEAGWTDNHSVGQTFITPANVDKVTKITLSNFKLGWGTVDSGSGGNNGGIVSVSLYEGEPSASTVVATPDGYQTTKILSGGPLIAKIDKVYIAGWKYNHWLAQLCGAETNSAEDTLLKRIKINNPDKPCPKLWIHNGVPGTGESDLLGPADYNDPIYGGESIIQGPNGLWESRATGWQSDTTLTVNFPQNVIIPGKTYFLEIKQLYLNTQDYYEEKKFNCDGPTSLYDISGALISNRAEVCNKGQVLVTQISANNPYPNGRAYYNTYYYLADAVPLASVDVTYLSIFGEETPPLPVNNPPQVTGWNQLGDWSGSINYGGKNNSRNFWIKYSDPDGRNDLKKVEIIFKSPGFRAERRQESNDNWGWPPSIIESNDGISFSREMLQAQDFTVTADEPNSVTIDWPLKFNDYPPFNGQHDVYTKATDKQGAISGEVYLGKWGVDTQVDTVSCSTPTSTTSKSFEVSWYDVKDNGGSGAPAGGYVFQVQYQVNNGQWKDWLSSAKDTYKSTFGSTLPDGSGQVTPNTTYGFKIRTADKAGNRLSNSEFANLSASCATMVLPPSVANQPPWNYSARPLINYPSDPWWSGNYSLWGKNNPVKFETIYVDNDGIKDSQRGLNYLSFWIDTGQPLSSGYNFFYAWLILPYRYGGNLPALYVFDGRYWNSANLIPTAFDSQNQPTAFKIDHYLTSGNTTLSPGTTITLTSDVSLKIEWEVYFSSSYYSSKGVGDSSHLKMLVTDNQYKYDGWDLMGLWQTDMYVPYIPWGNLKATPQSVVIGNPVTIEASVADYNSGLEQIKFWAVPTSSWQNPTTWISLTSFAGDKKIHDPNYKKYTYSWNTTGQKPGDYYVFATSRDVAGNDSANYQGWVLYYVPYRLVTLTQAIGCLEGYVWEDNNNADGIRLTSEYSQEPNIMPLTPLSGFWAQDSAGNKFSITNVTNAGAPNSNFSHNSLPVGTYKVYLTLNEDFQKTKWNKNEVDGGGEIKTSYNYNQDGNTYFSGELVVKEGIICTKVNLGIRKYGKIQGYVFTDDGKDGGSKNSGKKDGGEIYYPGAIAIRLDYNLQSSTQNGTLYTFNKVTPGLHTVDRCLSTPTDYTDGRYNIDDSYVSPAPSCTASSVDVKPGQTLNVNFGLLPVTVVSWWQTGGGDVYVNGNLVSKIPQTALDKNFNRDVAGVVSLKDKTDFGSGKTNSKDWRLESYTHDWFGNRVNDRQDYAWFYKLFGQPTQNNFDGSQKPSGTYYASGDVTIGSDWNVTGGTKIVVLVGGKLTINSKIKIDNSSFVAFIAKNGIEVSKDLGLSTPVSQPTTSDSVLDGVYLTDGQISTGTSDKQFVGAGLFVAYGGFARERDLGSSNNKTIPSESYLLRTDFLINIPDSLKKPTYTWQEVAP